MVLTEVSRGHSSPDENRDEGLNVVVVLNVARRTIRESGTSLVIRGTGNNVVVM